jgi:hypothetical protein
MNVLLKVDSCAQRVKDGIRAINNNTLSALAEAYVAHLEEVVGVKKNSIRIIKSDISYGRGFYYDDESIDRSRNRLAYILADVPASPVVITDVPVPASFDSRFIGNWTLAGASSDAEIRLRKKYVSGAGSEPWLPGKLFSFANYALLIRMSSQSFKDNPIVRMLKGYISQGRDPDGLVTTRSAPIELNIHRRTQTLLNGCFWWANYFEFSTLSGLSEKELTLCKDAFEEVVRYLILSPDAHQNGLKDAFSIPVLQGFMRSRSGISHRFGSSPLAEDIEYVYDTVTIEKLGDGDVINDTDAYAVVSDEIDEILGNVESLGLMKLAEILRYSLYMPVTKYHVRICTMLSVLANLTGFTRSDPFHSLGEELSEKPVPEVVGGYPVSKYVYEMTRDIYMLAKDSIPDGDRFSMGVMSYLTSKSAGMSGDPIDVALPMMGMSDEGGNTKTVYAYRDRSKIVYGLMRFVEMLNTHHIRNDETNPIKIATRIVPGGKGARTVYPKPIGYFLMEVVLFLECLRMTQYKYGAESLKLLNSFSVGEDTGDAALDLYRVICTSGNPGVMFFGADADNFDQSVQWWNVRKFMFGAIRDVMKQHGIWGTRFQSNPKGHGYAWGTYGDMLEFLWGEGGSINVHVLLKDFIGLTNSLNSGEFITNFAGSLATGALIRCIFDKMDSTPISVSGVSRQLRDVLEPIGHEFMGDDSAIYMQPSHLLRGKGVKKAAELAFITIAEEVFLENKFKMKKRKTTMGLLIANYLKRGSEMRRNLIA